MNDRLTGLVDSNSKTVSYHYNTLGQRDQMDTPDGRTITYGYNTGNRLGQITLSSLNFNLGYDLAGRRTSLSFPNGATTSYAYNEASFLTSLVARNSQQATINSFSYTPDGIGNRASMTDLAGQHSYTYDDTYQLTQATHPNMPTEQFGYDAVGNRTASGQPTPSLSTALYAYDFENRLTDVSYSDMAVHYKYDPFGRRIEKNVDGTITKYVYDGPNIVTQYDGDWNIQGKYLFTLDIDDPLMVQQGDNVYYYHKDGLGSVVNLTDSSQTTVKGYTYKSFGDIYSETGSLVQPFIFTGREYDPESGLYYYRARYYDPRTGRFITKDPIGIDGGDANLYRYVQNNPVNRIDPLGLYDLWDFGEGTLSFAAGLGNAVTFGGSTWIAEQFMSSGDAGILRRTKRCSGAFKGGEWASLALGGGRLAYAGIAKGASMIYAARGATMANAAAASAFRNGLKQVFRLGLWRDARIYTSEQMVEKYGTAEAIIAAAGRTDTGINIFGAAAAAGGATTVATTDDCGCK